MVTIRNNFDTLQVTYTLNNNEYENFVTTCIEVAAKCIPTKLRAKC